jgi:hypothetical protein
MMRTFDELRDILDRLVENEFRDSMRGFLSAEEQTRLPQAVESIDRGGFLGWLQKKQRLGEYGEYLLKRYPSVLGLSTSPAANLHVYFTNRQDEIDKLTSSSTSAGQYFLVYAPAGYGKSELLVEVSKRFDEKSERWDHALVVIDKGMTIDDLTGEIAQKLGVTIPSGARTRWGSKLGSALIRHYQQNHTVNLALLIDLTHGYPVEVLSQIFDEFIPDLWESLSSLDSFSEKKSLFRVILTGRNLVTSSEIRSLKSNLPLTYQALSPFTYEVICDTVRKYLIRFNPRHISQLSAHILYLTGGHPGCIANALSNFRDLGVTPDKFLAEHGRTVWKNIVYPVAEQVFSSIPDCDNGLGVIVNRLCIFRNVDNSILDKALGFSSLEQHLRVRDACDLSDKLTTSYIFRKEGRYLKDDIMRRLLVIRLRNQLPDFYAQYCKDAIEMCRARLEETNIPHPERWVVEYLFLSLQKFAGRNLLDSDVCREMRNEFDELIEDGLTLFLDKRNIPEADKPDEISALLSEMDEPENWEFRFLINYCFRDNQYTEQPFQDLKDKIASHLTGERHVR